MNHDVEILHELCEAIMRDIEQCNNEIRMGGGELKSGNVEYIDKLTHALKSIKTTIAMIEADDSYSGRYMPYYYGADDNRGGRGRSYARGRYDRRDSMGRYSRDGGYSYAAEMDDIISDIRGMMGEMPETKRAAAERFINELKG